MAPSGLAVTIGAGPTSGAGIARLLAVALLARNADNLAKLRDSVRQSSNGGVLHLFPTDTQPDSLRQAFSDMASHPDLSGLSLKLAIYHVKHSSKGPFLDGTAEDFGASLQTYTVYDGGIVDEDSDHTTTGKKMSAEAVGRTYLWLSGQEPGLWVHELDLWPTQDTF